MGEPAGINLLDYGCIRTFPTPFVQGVIDLYTGLLTGKRDLVVHAYETWGFTGLSAELIDTLNIWARFIYGPLLDDREREIADGTTPGQYGRKEAFTVHKVLKEKGPVKVPREFVFMDRAAIGLGGVFLHLGATLNWHNMFNETIAGFTLDEVGGAAEGGVRGGGRAAADSGVTGWPSKARSGSGSAAGRSSRGAGVFYPKGLPHSKELEYASRKLTTIEINGTFYRTQTPATFAKWAAEVPDGFVFSVKGPRYAVNRSVLAEAGDSIKRFINSGPLEMGDKLGPMLWQFAPTKKFDAADFGKFLELLPAEDRRAQAAPRRRGAACLVLRARVHRPAAPVRNPRGVRRAREISGHRRSGRRFRLRAAAEGRGRHPHRLSAEGARTPGPSAPACGPRARCLKACRSPIRPRRPRPPRATCSSTSSTKARCARRRRRWR